MIFTWNNIPQSRYYFSIWLFCCVNLVKRWLSQHHAVDHSLTKLACLYCGYYCFYSKSPVIMFGHFFSAFSASIPHVPIQVLAVTGSASGASVVFHSNDVPVTLLADGVNLASKLCAKFQTTNSKLQHQGMCCMIQT